MAEQRESSPRIEDGAVDVDEVSGAPALAVMRGAAADPRPQELKLMQARLAEMEAEKNTIAASETAEGGAGEPDASMEDDEAPAAVDARSVYIGNVSRRLGARERRARTRAGRRSGQDG